MGFDFLSNSPNTRRIETCVLHHGGKQSIVYTSVNEDKSPMINVMA